MNVLKKIVIPKTQSTIHYILLELEELSREDFFRMKCILKNKKKNRFVKGEDETVIEDCPIKDVVEEVIEKCRICSENCISQIQEEIIEYTQPDKVTSIVISVTKSSRIIGKPEPKDDAKPEDDTKPEDGTKQEEVKSQNDIPKSISSPPTPLFSDTKNVTPAISFVDEIPQTVNIEPSKLPETQFSLIKSVSEGVMSRISGLLDTKNLEKLKELLSAVANMGKQLLERGSKYVEFNPFIKVCDETVNRLQDELQEHEMDKETKEKLEHLQVHIKEVINVVNDFEKDKPLSNDMANILNICENIDKKIDAYVKDSKGNIMPETKSKLQLLKEHIQHVENVTKEYEAEGLLNSSVEEFYTSCKEFITKIDDCSHNKGPTQLETLKSQVIDLEKLTKSIHEDGFVANGAENFIKSCQEFQTKLNVYNEKQKSVSKSASLVTKLKSQLDETISLSKKVGEERLLSESILNFVKSCEIMKSKLDPIQKETTVLDELKNNIDNIMNSINKYKQHGLVTESVNDFINTCEMAKAKLQMYELLADDSHSHTCSVHDCYSGAADEEECITCLENVDETDLNKTYSFGISIGPSSPVASVATKEVSCNACIDNLQDQLPVKSVETEEVLCKTCNEPSQDQVEQYKSEVDILQTPYISETIKVPAVYSSTKKVKLPEEKQDIEATVEPSDDENLGYHETKVRKIIRVTRSLNVDGTVSEAKETVIVKEDKHDPEKTSIGDDDEYNYDDTDFDDLLQEKIEEKK